jgi:hypothetical protein
LCGGWSVGAQAQKDQSAKNVYYDYAKPPARTRPNQQRRGRPGAMVKLELKRDDRVSYVRATESFYAGDRVRLHIRVNRDAYLTILNQGTTGDLQLIYPKTQDDAERKITKTMDFTVPTTPGNWLKFDKNPGVERMIIILSAQPTREVLVALSGQSSPPSSASPQPRPRPSANDDQQNLEVVALLNSKSLGDELDKTSKDFTEVADDNADDGQPATFAVSSGNNADLRKPVIYKLNLRHERKP